MWLRFNGDWSMFSWIPAKDQYSCVISEILTLQKKTPCMATKNSATENGKQPPIYRSLATKKYIKILTKNMCDGIPH